MYDTCWNPLSRAAPWNNTRSVVRANWIDFDLPWPSTAADTVIYYLNINIINGRLSYNTWPSCCRACFCCAKHKRKQSRYEWHRDTCECTTLIIRVKFYCTKICHTRFVYMCVYIYIQIILYYDNREWNLYVLIAYIGLERAIAVENCNKW
jgi:hypothetical protein